MLFRSEWRKPLRSAAPCFSRGSRRVKSRSDFVRRLQTLKSLSRSPTPYRRPSLKIIFRTFSNPAKLFLDAFARQNSDMSFQALAEAASYRFWLPYLVQNPPKIDEKSIANGGICSTSLFDRFFIEIFSNIKAPNQQNV